MRLECVTDGYLAINVPTATLVRRDDHKTRVRQACVLGIGCARGTNGCPFDPERRAVLWLKDNCSRWAHPEQAAAFGPGGGPLLTAFAVQRDHGRIADQRTRPVCDVGEDNDEPLTFSGGGARHRTGIKP